MCAEINICRGKGDQLDSILIEIACNVQNTNDIDINLSSSKNENDIPL